MGFKDDILKLAIQISERKSHIANEETTKHSLIIPFIQVLGFDIFNPLEVKPEYVADFGKKRGEKVDYAIFKNGNPIVFIESKSINENLDNHDSQLSRYFNSTPEVKIAILSNGIQYKFFTDLSQNNVMDNSPFFEINIENLKDSDIEALAKFRKDVFDNENLVTYAEELVYMANLNRNLKELFKNPSDEFIRFLIKDFSESRITSSVIERFKPIVKKAIQYTLVEIISQGILKNGDEVPGKQEPELMVPDQEQAMAELSDIKKQVITTEEELQMFERIKNILISQGKDISQVNYKDTINYFGIYKRNTTGWFLRLNLESSVKQITSRLLLDETTSLSAGFKVESAPKGLGESRITLDSIDDIDKLKDFITRSFEVVENY